MPISLRSSSGDGASVPPIPPGELVVTEVYLASEIPRGPKLPLFLNRIPAGFPSPADDYIEDRLDVHELLGLHSPSCFVLRVDGESMTGAGIYDGDVVVVDRALTPVTGSVVVASVDGDLTLKRFVRQKGRVMLLACNPAFPSIELQGEQELIIWGVVTYNLHGHVRGQVPGKRGPTGTVGGADWS